MKEKNQQLYYQYRASEGFPIFVKLVEPQLESQMSSFLNEMGFEKCNEEVLTKEHDRPEYLRVLKISVAGPMVSKQIGQVREEDRYGLESISSRGDYKVYRFKGVGIMVFSEGRFIWEMGLMNRFSQEDFHYKLRIVFNRFLGYCLASYNIIGVWGVSVDEGAVVMSQAESKGEAVFIDLDNQVLHTIEGLKPLSFPLQFLKLDESIKNQSRKLQVEELVSLLTHYNTYFSDEGFSSSFQKRIFALARSSEGILYPKENFKPREKEKAA